MAVYHKDQPFVGNLTHFPWIRHGIWTNGAWKCHKSKRYFESPPFSKETSQGLVFKYPRKGTISKGKGRLPVPSFFQGRSASFRGCSFLVAGWNEQICLSNWIVFPNRLDLLSVGNIILISWHEHKHPELITFACTIAFLRSCYDACFIKFI